MNVVLAAIDHTGVADSVVETATTWAEIAGAAVRIIHVRESPTTAASVSDRFGDRYAEHELLVVDGNPSDEIVRAVADPDVALVVVGARQEVDGARPAGHIALSIVERANKPVVVVPPCAGGASATERSSTIRRALVPLEGSAHTSEAIAATLRLLTGAGIELIALHVFDADSVPAFWDQPSHAAESYAADFVSRWCAEPGTELLPQHQHHAEQAERESGPGQPVSALAEHAGGERRGQHRLQRHQQRGDAGLDAAVDGLEHAAERGGVHRNADDGGVVPGTNSLVSPWIWVPGPPGWVP